MLSSIQEEPGTPIGKFHSRGLFPTSLSAQVYLFIALGFGGSLHIHPRDSEPACLTRTLLIYNTLSLLTIYTSHSVKIFPMRLVRARALEYDINIGRGTHDLCFRVKLLTRLLYRSTTNCQLTTQTDYEHGSALTPQLRTLPYSGSNISNS